jgi:hypothetical protein
MPVAVSGEAPIQDAAVPRQMNPTSAVSLDANSRVTSTASAQACEPLSLVLGPVQIEILDMTVQVDQVKLDFVARSNGRLGTLLCGATNVIDNGARPAEQMKILNTLLNEVG